MEWRCFHCDSVFTNRKHAAEHFGASEADIPACKLAQSDGHLVSYIRELERELTTYRREDSHILRAFDALKAEHAAALIREEERGFARGVEDMKQHGYLVP